MCASPLSATGGIAALPPSFISSAGTADTAWAAAEAIAALDDDAAEVPAPAMIAGLADTELLAELRFDDASSWSAEQGGQHSDNDKRQ